MPTTFDELLNWIQQPLEDQHLEFKTARQHYSTENAMRYCVAIANERGGKLILGISDSLPRQIEGTSAFLNTQEIQSKIFQKLRFRVDVEEITNNEKRVVIFHIPSRPIGMPLEFEGAYLMRVGEELHPMSPDQLRTIFEEGKPDWFSEVALSDIHFSKLENYLDFQSYFKLANLRLPPNESAFDRFEHERLLVRDGDFYGITNLGAILFAKRLSHFEHLQRRAIRVIVYNGTNKTSETKADTIGEKGYAAGFEGLIEYVNSFLPKNEIIGKALRETIPMYPSIAIRELIANAIIHQDYNETGTSVIVEIYHDRIEVSNPGLPFISLERFIDEFQSRNERLASLARRLRICEEKGSGIDKVIHSVEAYQLPAPDFRAGQKRTLAILFGHKELDEMDNSDKIRACYQHCVLKWVMNEKMSNQTLRERFKLPESKSDFTSRIIRDAVEANLVKLANPESSSKRYAQYIPFWA